MYWIGILQGGKILVNKLKRFMEQILENFGLGIYSTERYIDFRFSKFVSGSMQNKGNVVGSVSINGCMERIFVSFFLKEYKQMYVCYFNIDV